MESIEEGKKEFWDSFSEGYSKLTEVPQLYPASTLFVMTHAFESRRVLELSCGSGMQALFYASTLMQPGTVMFATDFSDTMLSLVQKNFDKADYTKNPKNVFKVLEGALPAGYSPEVERREEGKTVIAANVNNLELPFEDGYFESLVSNMSLHLVPDHKKMLREAYRVTKAGGMVGFSVWGRKENTYSFWLLSDAFDHVGIAHGLQSHDHMLHLGVH